MADPRKPVETIRRMNKMHGVVREEIAIERPRCANSETCPKSSSLLLYLLIKAWQWLEKSVEVISRKIIKEHLQCWWPTIQEGASGGDSIQHLRNDNKCVGTRRASQVCYLQTLRKHVAGIHLLDVFLQYRLCFGYHGSLQQNVSIFIKKFLEDNTGNNDKTKALERETARRELFA